MKEKLLLIFAEKIFTGQNTNLPKLDGQLQIVFQILVNKGYEVLVSGDGDQSFEFAKRFSYIFQDKSIKTTKNKVNDLEKCELMKNSNCIICFQEELVESVETLNRPCIFIDVEEKNVGEKSDIEGKFDVFTIDSLNAGKIVKRVEKLISSGLDVEKETRIGVKKQKSNFTQNSSDKFEEYKKQIKKTVEKFINNNELEKAKNLVNEYESIVKDDADIYSMKGIIAIMEGDMEEAKKTLKEGLLIYPISFDLLYNLGYLYGIQEKYRKAYEYYGKAFILADKDTTKKQLQNKISELENIQDVRKYKVDEKDNITIERIKIKMKMQVAKYFFVHSKN